MSEQWLPDGSWFAYGVLPVLIFLARVLDVSVGTLRLIFVSRGHKMVAPLLGFFEVTIWLLAIGQIMQNLRNPLCYIAYGGGFAMGNFVGIWLEERLATGFSILWVVTQLEATRLAQTLRERGHGLTVFRGEGLEGPVNVVYVVLRRRHVAEAVALAREHNPQAFYTVSEARSVLGGVVPISLPRLPGMLVRKGK